MGKKHSRDLYLVQFVEDFLLWKYQLSEETMQKTFKVEIIS